MLSRTDPEELDEVMELAVHVSTDGDRARNRLHVRLLHKDLSCLAAVAMVV